MDQQRKLQRSQGRGSNELRPLKTSYKVFEYADGSVLLEWGKTKILCAVSLQNSIPPFLRGTQQGWLNAEYALLPMSTHTRSQRESSQMKRSGRSIEISRFISRSLRTIVNLSLIGERTINVDCDVLQADGGTRVASVTASCIALRVAQDRWLRTEVIKQPILQDLIAAVSVGLVDNEVLLDIDYLEDSRADADFNFVVTQSNKLIEILGGAEKAAIDWDTFEQMKVCALKGINDIFKTLYSGTDPIISQIPLRKEYPVQTNGATTSKDPHQPKKAPFFSIQNRN